MVTVNQRLGAEFVAQYGSADQVAEVREATAGRGIEVALDERRADAGQALQGHAAQPPPPRHGA